MEAPRIFLVRHGEAEHNAAYRIEGEIAFYDRSWQNARLTEQGGEQALKAGEELVAVLGQGAKAIFWCSPLDRCIETAKYIARSIPPISFTLHDDFIECLGGGHVCNERDLPAQIRLKWPDVNASLIPERPPVDTDDPRETFEQAEVRMKRGIAMVRAQATGPEPIIIVTHHDAVKALTGVSLKNAQVVEIERPHAAV